MLPALIASPNTEQELKDILLKNGDKITVLIFSTAWCKNCKRLGPGLDQVSQDLVKVASFVHVDVDEFDVVVQEHNITDLPTFQFYRRGILQSTISAKSLPKVGTYQEADQQLLKWIRNQVANFVQGWNADYSKITDHLAFSPTLTSDDIDKLKAVGFKSVIGMESKEARGYLAKESDLWEAQGVQFATLPIKAVDEITLSDFDQFLQLVESMPGPILIHSDIGQTAAIFVFATVAKQNQRQGSEVPEWATALGFDFEGLGRTTQLISAWVNS